MKQEIVGIECTSEFKQIADMKLLLTEAKMKRTASESQG